MIEDPNRIIKNMLREEDAEFAELERKMEEIQAKLCKATDATEKEQLRRQLRFTKDRVDTAIRFARSV